MRRLVASGITQRFGNGAAVLDDVDFELSADGSSVAVIAPSGSGKTTLLAVLGGLMVPTAGSVSVVGRERDEPSIGHVAWILQTTNLLPRRSARDNVAMGALARGGSRDDVALRVDDVLGRVGLEAVCGKAARFLSGGEAQRLAVARAVVSRSLFVFADEPTGQLDRHSSDQVAEVLFEATRAFRCGLVLVTHDIDLANRCERVLSLEGGKLRE